MTVANFETRPLAMSDAERYAETVNATFAFLGIDDRIQASAAELEWREPGFDLAASSLGIFDPSGLLAGYGTFWATSQTPVRPDFGWGVHPKYHACGLEAQLFSWADRQSREVVSRCPPDARVSLHCATNEGYAFAEAALENAGFTRVRAFFDMGIEMSTKPCAPPLPEGITTRPYRHEADLPLLVDVVRDAFSDHFGHVDEPFEKDLELIRHWLNNDPHFDPDLVIFPVAEDTGEVAGCLLGLTQDYRNPAAGYIDTVGVRQRYRRRGLATAMLQRSLAMFWDRGTKKVNLDVDGESLTNAVALYERVGMRVYRRYSVYEKLLRDGVELAKVALD